MHQNIFSWWQERQRKEKSVYGKDSGVSWYSRADQKRVIRMNPLSSLGLSFLSAQRSIKKNYSPFRCVFTSMPDGAKCCIVRILEECIGTWFWFAYHPTTDLFQIKTRFLCLVMEMTEQGHMGLQLYSCFALRYKALPDGQISNPVSAFWDKQNGTFQAEPELSH